tara:strand:+ start:1786 stop:1950 length:165 start_codon:yes stop_codon:yes gene_type:complete
MTGKTSELAKRIELKYGKTKLGDTYEIDGQFYKLTDGNIDELSNRVYKLINDFK